MHAPPQPYLCSSTFRRSIVFCAGYAAVALACLWPRVDVFSGGAAAISVAVILQRYKFGFDLPWSREVVREYFGSGFDPLLDALGGCWRRASCCRFSTTGISGWREPWRGRGCRRPVSSAVRIKAVHRTELRTALDAARAQLGLPALVYTGGNTIKAAHVTDLRNGVQ